MTTVVLQHVRVALLPEEWRARLAKTGDTLVTVHIEEEIPDAAFVTDDPAFGIWRDREDVADIAVHVRGIRHPRYNHDGSRNET